MTRKRHYLASFSSSTRGRLIDTLGVALIAVLTSCQPMPALAQGWVDGGNRADACYDFAAVAGGVAGLKPHEKAQLHEASEQLSEYRRDLIREALLLVTAEQLTNSAIAQQIALTRCTGHRKSGPSLWKWNIGTGWVGPY